MRRGKRRRSERVERGGMTDEFQSGQGVRDAAKKSLELRAQDKKKRWRVEAHLPRYANDPAGVCARLVIGYFQPGVQHHNTSSDEKV